jgi:uncharacterized protein (DUF1501 family)
MMISTLSVVIARRLLGRRGNPPFFTLPRWIASLSARNDVDRIAPLSCHSILLPAFAGLTAFIAFSAFAQPPATPSQADIAATVQKLSGKKNSQEALGQVIAIGSILGCTQKTAGKPATQAFYSEMQAIGKTIEAYCQGKRASEARALALSTFAAKKNDAVVTAALGCYDTQLQTVNALAGERMAADAANYARWLKNPEIAKAEMKDSDICR